MGLFSDQSRSFDRDSEPAGAGSSSWGLAVYLLIGAGVFLVVVLAVILTFWIKGNRRLNHQLSQAENEGLPVTADQVRNAYDRAGSDRVARPDTPVSEDLRELVSDLEEAHESVLKRTNYVGRSGNSGMPSRKDRRTAAGTILKKLDPYEEEIQHILSSDPAPAKIRIERGPDATMDHIEGRRDRGDVLSLYGRAQLFRGHFEAYRKAVRALFAEGEALMKEPSFISFLLGLSLQDDALTLCEYSLLLPEQEMTIDQIEALEQAIGEINPGTWWNLALKAEFYSNGVVPIKNLTGEMDTISLEGPLGMVPGGWFAPEMGANYIEEYRNFARAARKPTHTSKRKLQKAREDLQQKKKGYISQFLNYFSFMLMPAVQEARSETDRLIARRELIKLALKVRERQVQGTSPVVPDLKDTVDPFTGDPYRKKETDAFWVLYSTGDDGTDDGATWKNPDTNRDLPVFIRKQKK